MKPNKLLILFSFLLYSVLNFSQTTLIGKIATDKGEPVTNAFVYLDTIKTKTAINVIGYFEVTIPEGTKEITVHAPKYGYLTTEYANENRLSFVFLEPKKENTITKVVEGNSTTSSSINTLDVSQDKNASTYNNIYDYIDGKIAGVSVINNQITIRGGSSLELSNEPLFVVNGIILSSIRHIPPTDVDNINVLKGVDASLYGSRGSNGVIEITTK